MAKTLAGVLAVSIAALLFASCTVGGSSESVGTTTTISSSCRIGYLNAALFLQRSAKEYQDARSTSLQQDEDRGRKYADALAKFDFTIGGLDCPPEIVSQIVKLIEVDQIVVNLYRNDPSFAGFRITSEMRSSILAATTIIRSALGLEPPVDNRFVR
jgi:hypothetical protein